jgi:formylglycine-generating enzyme required for sulfatase activity
MTFRTKSGAGLVTVLLALAVGMGCSRSERMLPLANLDVQLPPGVELPDGFYPLKGNSDPANPEDNYNGWPRYIVSTRDRMIMAYVPSITFRMGGGIGLDEVPQREVVINHFYMDLHEVTNAQFACFLENYKPKKAKSDSTCVRGLGGSLAFGGTGMCGACSSCGACGACASCELGGWWVSPQAHHSLPDWYCANVSDAFLAYWARCHNDDHPVRNVSWWDAYAYSLWSRKVLPSEAQWEAAARGDDQRIYPWGNDAQSDVTRYLANTQTGRADFDGYEFTAPAMNFAAGVSPFGIFQLSGNVWEWCADWYDPGRYAYPSDEDPPSTLQRGYLPFGDRNYPNPIAKDIREARVGPIIGARRVVRGGSFANPIENCRVESRDALHPYVHQNNVGFRTILPLPPQRM